MKAKQLFDKFLDNWQVKAICFVIALFLYVVYQTKSVDKRVFSVPLTIESKNGFVSIEPHPRTVVVSARGKSEELAQVRDSDLSAYLDLNYVSKDGAYDFPVLITLSDSASVLNPLELKVTPEVVHLRVEEEVTSFVDIKPLVSGKPGFGFGIKSVSVSPEQIEIHGPKTMIENCTSLQTLNVTANGAKRSFTVKTKIEKKGLFIWHDDEDVSVTVEIEELDGAKQFTKLPVTVVNLSPEYEVKAITSDVTVTLRGSLSALENYKPDENFVTIDASSISSEGTFYMDLSYALPKRFELQDGYTKTIPVTFTQKTNASQDSEVDEEKITVLEEAGGILDETVEQTKKR